MPKGLVDSPRDERLWERAKQIVRRQYPDVAEDEDSGEFGRLVNGIYQKMRKGGRGRMDGTGPRGGTEACPVTKSTDEPPVGSGERFRRLSRKLSQRADVRDPDALAAAIGRRKYGQERFERMAAKGRMRKAVRPLLIFGDLAALRKAARQLSLFDEQDHPRHPAGSPKGGQFAPKGTPKGASRPRDVASTVSRIIGKPPTGDPETLNAVPRVVSWARAARQANNGALVLVRVGDEYQAYDQDAADLHILCRRPLSTREGYAVASIPADSLDRIVSMLSRYRKVAVMHNMDTSPDAEQGAAGSDELVDELVDALREGSELRSRLIWAKPTQDDQAWAKDILERLREKDLVTVEGDDIYPTRALIEKLEARGPEARHAVGERWYGLLDAAAGRVQREPEQEGGDWALPEVITDPYRQEVMAELKRARGPLTTEELAERVFDSGGTDLSLYAAEQFLRRMAQAGYIQAADDGRWAPLAKGVRRRLVLGGGRRG
ncbi:MAG: hypothetical protein AB7Y46_16800 [Armatimonadota bacterium]